MHNNHHNFGNPYISFIVGGIFGIGGFFAQHPAVTDFSIDLARVCLFGFLGGVLGEIGRRTLNKLFGKKK